MKNTNHLFTAFERRFNLVGRNWAEWMTKKEAVVSTQRKKAWLVVFVVLMIAVLWLPLVFKTKPRVVDVGSISPPVSLDRNEYQLKIRRMNYLIDSIESKSQKVVDSLGRKPYSDTLK